MPRVNRVIELLEHDQPVFATSAAALTHEAGVTAAQTRADFFIAAQPCLLAIAKNRLVPAIERTPTPRVDPSQH